MKALIGMKELYLSPQLMKCLSRREKLPVHNPYKSDVWSIGLTILEMATLLSIDDCYDWENCTISYTVI